MVLRCLEIDKAQKPPPVAATAGPSFSIPFKNPTLRWGRTRRMRFQPVSDRHGPNDLHPPPPASHQPKNDPSPSCGCFSVPFKNPTLRWGSSSRRRMCYQLVSDHRDPTDRRPSSASPSPPPTPHQTKNDPTPPLGRSRLVIRIPCRTQTKVLDRDRPPAPEHRDHCQETREATAGGAPLEIARPVAGPVMRSFRSGAGSQGEEKTAKKVRPAEFSISLTNKEIMEDFIAMTSAKPTRRPKKRPRLLEKKLDEIFPGSELPKIITSGLYSLR